MAASTMSAGFIARRHPLRWRHAGLAMAFALSMALSVPARAAGADADPSDLWWNPAESGWGLQLVQGGTAIFATLYVYDAAGDAIFFTATLEPAGAAWSGPLYQTSGPYFAAASFDPARVVARLAGTLQFAPASAQAGVLRYVVDGTAVTRNVQRQLLRYDDYSGRYAVAVQRVTSHCSDPRADGDRTLFESLVIAQTGTALQMEWKESNRVCHLAGSFSQAGKLGSSAMTYSCSDGEEGDLSFHELTRRNGFVAGRMQGHSISNGCDYRGQFTGLVAN
jgi:hypothetical protein